MRPALGMADTRLAGGPTGPPARQRDSAPSEPGRHDYGPDTPGVGGESPRSPVGQTRWGMLRAAV